MTLTNNAQSRDLTGQTFGRLTAIRCVDPQSAIWEFRCCCDGRIRRYPAASVLRRKDARRSCGCLRVENAIKQGEANKVPLPVAFLRNLDLQNHPIPQSCRGFGPCLLWKGSVDTSGRAQMSVNRHSARASHVAWYLVHRYKPKYLCHTCDVRRCVNPSHLIEGGPGLNGWDRKAKKRGGILEAASPFDPFSDQRHEDAMRAFVDGLREYAMSQQQEKAK